MKKLFMIMALALISCSMSFAQQENGSRPRKQFDKTTMIKMRTERTAKYLGLSEAQSDSLLKLNTKYADLIASANRPVFFRGHSANDSTKLKSIKETVANNKENMKKYEEQVKALLTPEQAEKYEKMQQEKRNNMKRRPIGVPGRRPNSDNNQNNTNNNITIGETE